MKKYAVFFRNLNLGRPRCPNRSQFETAFAEAGGDAPSAFLTNGTLVFGARSEASARRIVTDARARLQETCGLTEPAFLRSLDALRALAACQPFAAIDPAGVYERCVSFLHPDARPPALPLESKRGDLRVLSCTPGEVFSVSLKLGKSPGSPNPLLEKRLGLPCTTRAWNTVVRLLARHG